MKNKSATSFRLSREDKKLLAELARHLRTSQSETVRLLIRVAVKDLREKRETAKSGAKNNEQPVG